jgi:hypothetical protein
MGRDRIEAGQIWRRGEDGARVDRVKWEGKTLKPGQGRKVDEGRWKARKEERRGKLDRPEGERQAAPYREVDYMTGRRVLYRAPKSGEVVVPKGRKRTRER